MRFFKSMTIFGLILGCTSAFCQFPGFDPVGDIGKAAGTIINKGGEVVNNTVNTVKKGADDTKNTVVKGADDAKNTVVKGADDAKNTVVKGADDAKNTVVKGADDYVKTLEKSGNDLSAETSRAAANLLDAGRAVERYLQRSKEGTGRTLSSAERRVREGKVIDALWHLGTDPIRTTDEAAAMAAQESTILNTIGQTAATAYGGPGGAAAYAAWYTYHQTKNPELAIRVGLLTGATSLAFNAAGKMPSETANELARKAVVTGAIGGIAVAAAGGDEKDIKEGFLRAGGMVLVQDGYRRVTSHKLDPRASGGDAYCMCTEQVECSPPDDAYIRDNKGNIQRDANGNPLVDVTKTDPRRPHVGLWSKKDDPGVFDERSKSMTAVSKIPGMNAMSVFHDQWAVSWNMGPVATAVSIVPAVVLTYTGTGAPYFELLRKTAAKTSVGSKQRVDPTQPLPSSSPSERNRMRVMYSQSVVASYLLTKGSSNRTLLIEKGRGSDGSNYRVVYLTETERSVLWQAKWSPSYCERKAREFVAKQKSWGWSCFIRG